jgi:hypothetical protein
MNIINKMAESSNNNISAPQSGTVDTVDTNVAINNAINKVYKDTTPSNSINDIKDNHAIDINSRNSDFIPESEVKTDLATEAAQNNFPEELVTEATSSIPDSAVTEEMLEITEDMKSKFIDAIITGDRFTQSYSMFNGKLNFTLRNRTLEEDQAVIAYVAHLDRTSEIRSRQDYQIKLRLALLAAQVESLNGIKFEPLKEPLYTKSVGIELILPGWLTQLNFWAAQPPAVVQVIAKQLRLFESIYWTLTSKASVENFW